MYLSQFATIAIAHFLVLIAPGPDVALVIQESISRGKKNGIYTGFGIATGLLVHLTYTLVGLGLIISQSIFLFSLIKIAGACYLIYMGVKGIFTKSNNSFAVSAEKNSCTPRESFLKGFITNILNPKVTLFFLALFSSIVDPLTSIIIQIGYGVWMSIITFAWFAAVTLLLTKPSINLIFMRLGHWFDRVMGVVLVGLGLKLAVVTR